MKDTIGLETEIASCLAAGMRQYTMPTLRETLQSLGYEIEPDSRCACVAKNITTGNTYPCVTWGIREIDSKQNAFHVGSRRDTNFKALQELRFNSFVVQHGKMISI